MPEICSRVCPQEKLCEGSCILVGHAEPVCIGAIEKFINEYAFAHCCDAAMVSPANGLNVAVVGSGPGSLACADELARRSAVSSSWPIVQPPRLSNSATPWRTEALLNCASSGADHQQRPTFATRSPDGGATWGNEGLMAETYLTPVRFRHRR